MSKPRLLIAIVDDEESIRRALGRLMVSIGMNAAVYSGGEEFLSSLETTRPDCVILDLHMPGMGGFEVQEALARTGQPMPAVAITGHDAPGTEARAHSSGFAGYLRKPVTAKALMEAIEHAIGHTT